jgi:tricorn protease
VAYVYMPNTGGAGYTNFNRYFYSQLDKQALVLDERYNEGGFIADYVVDVLKRFPLPAPSSATASRFTTRSAPSSGPRSCSSTRTPAPAATPCPGTSARPASASWWARAPGAAWSASAAIPLLDGGYVMAPRYAIYGLNGDWEVENHGIAPDVPVEELPKDVAAGHDRSSKPACNWCWTS